MNNSDRIKTSTAVVWDGRTSESQEWGKAVLRSCMPWSTPGLKSDYGHQKFRS
jgi:hypothetical protein